MRITRLAAGIAAIIGLTVVMSATGSTNAQSKTEHVQASLQGALINRDESPFRETDFRLGDYQQLRRISLFDKPHDRLR